MPVIRETQFAFVLTLMLGMAHVFAAESQGRPAGPVPNRYIVTFEPGVKDVPAVAAELASIRGVQLRNTFTYALKGVVIEIASGSTAGILTALRHNPRVRGIAADHYISLADTNPKGVRRVSAEFGIGMRANSGSNIDVVVMDTGIDFSHPDLAPNVDTGNSVQCLAGNSCVPGGQDDEGHGTNVASAVAAAANGSGIVGVSPAVDMIAVKVLDATGNGTFANVIAGIDHILYLNQNVDFVEVVNMSFREICGSSCDGPDYQPVHQAVQNLVVSGTTVIAAAGNDSIDVSQVVPAGWPEVITVSAMADSDGLPGARGSQIRIFPAQRYPDDSFASFSNYGAGVDVIAPGVKELLARLGGGTEENTGTSFAAPYAAGVAAIFIRDRLDRGEPTPLPGAVRQALIETGECYQSGGNAGMLYHGTSGCPQAWPQDPDNAAEPLVRADNVANFGPALPVHDLAITAMDPGAPILAGGTHSVLVTIMNEGTENETGVSVSLSDDVEPTSTSGPQTVNLAAGATMNLSFTWTPGSAGGRMLTAAASQVAGEQDVGDNSLSKTVTVQNPVHDVAITGITAPTSVIVGETINVTMDVVNNGTFDETFDVSLSATTGSVSNDQSVTLIPGGTGSLTFTWDTVGGVLGTQTLEATAAQVPEETNLGNNSISTTATIVEPAAINLSAVGYKVKGRNRVDLSWSGATSANVDIWRDGSLTATTANDDSYTDAIDSRGGQSYTYQVCESGAATCSNQSVVIF